MGHLTSTQGQLSLEQLFLQASSGVTSCLQWEKALNNVRHHSVEHPGNSYLAGIEPVVYTALLHFTENKAILLFYWKIISNFGKRFSASILDLLIEIEPVCSSAGVLLQRWPAADANRSLNQMSTMLPTICAQISGPSSGNSLGMDLHLCVYLLLKLFHSFV